MPTQEERITTLEQKTQGIQEDISASFKQLVEYHIATENQIDKRFNQVDARLDRIEATMATKQDLAAMETKLEAMESRILGAFQQLVTIMSTQRPPTE